MRIPTLHYPKLHRVLALVGASIVFALFALPAGAQAPKGPADRAAAFAKDTVELGKVEERLRSNETYMKKYYASDDLKAQSGKDMVFLAVTKVTYLDKGTTAQEKAMGKKAAALLPKVQAQGRAIYASSLEHNFVKNGLDMKVRAQGADKKQLRISYALMSQPLVYKFQNDIKIDDQARILGFTRLVYTNGFDSSLGETWTIDLGR